MTDPPSPQPDPDQPNELPVQAVVADLVERYGVSGLLQGIWQYAQSKAAMFQAVDSDRRYAWMGLAHLLKQALDVAQRIESDEERGR